MSDASHRVLPWLLVPGVVLMVPMVLLRARWGTRGTNTRFPKILASGAVMMVFTVPAIGHALDQLLLRDVSKLVCESVAIYMSRQAALAMHHETAGRATRSIKRLNGILTITSLSGVVVLVTSYVGVLDAGGALQTFDARSLEPAALAFWITFSCVHGLNMAIALGLAVQARWGLRGATFLPERSSLSWWIIASGAIWAYILVIPVALLSLAVGHTNSLVVVNSQLLQAVPGLIGCLAATVCAATWADFSSRLQHTLLRPAWAWCTRTERDVVLYPFMHSPGPRLARRLTEMSLAVDRLLMATTSEERTQVRSAVSSGALRQVDARGVLLHAGRRRRLAGSSQLTLVHPDDLPRAAEGVWRAQVTFFRGRHFERIGKRVLQPTPDSASRARHPQGV